MLTAILFVLSEGCTWRGINQPGTNWNSVYQYYRRWCRDGIWEKVWQQVARAAKAGAVYGDSTFIKVHRCGLNAVGGRDLQAIGLTKGGWNTKLHAAVDGKGRPVALLLTGGQVADVSQATELLKNVEAKIMVLDKGYDSDALRIWLLEQGDYSLHPGQEQSPGAAALPQSFLPEAAYHRKLFRAFENLPKGRHTLRQTRRDISRLDYAGCNHQVWNLNLPTGPRPESPSRSARPGRR